MSEPLINEDWLQSVNDEIDEQIQMAVDNVVGDIEYHARECVKDQIDNCIDNIRMETCLNFAGNGEVKSKIREKIRDSILRSHNFDVDY